ncbi:cell wall-binding repeat-containing protein [Mobiluncus curtisii]|uniref:Cell wall binding repeat 2 n=1 Tax=Mobiluncus curtisii ATCC 51333 TaxID=887326 RepID=E6LXP9_9ACTO|nr:cell wall-binding repeat-containing protein [Mobiluncus curtisii]EFU80416.1 hypothetical protein HMPREF0388_0636 [Mobiluncus curtisii ATCC 51333]
MNLKKKFVIGAASLALVAGMGVAPAMADGYTLPGAFANKVDRLAGLDRIDTSMAVAKHEFTTEAKGGNGTKASVAYIVNYKAMVDAATSGMLTDGPVILVDNNRRTASIVGKFLKNSNEANGGAAGFKGIRAIYAIGGEGVVSKDTLESVAKEAGVSYTGRIDGKDRYETSANVAKRIYNQALKSEKHANNVMQPVFIDQRGNRLGKVYLANGGDNHVVDSMAAGVLDDGPILYVNPDGTIPEPVAEFIKATLPKSWGILGGEGAVSNETASTARAIAVYKNDWSEAYDVPALRKKVDQLKVQVTGNGTSRLATSPRFKGYGATYAEANALSGLWNAAYTQAVADVNKQINADLKNKKRVKPANLTAGYYQIGSLLQKAYGTYADSFDKYKFYFTTDDEGFINGFDFKNFEAVELKKLVEDAEADLNRVWGMESQDMTQLKDAVAKATQNEVGPYDGTKGVKNSATTADADAAMPVAGVNIVSAFVADAQKTLLEQAKKDLAEAQNKLAAAENKIQFTNEGRLGGKDRFETAAAIAQYWADNTMHVFDDIYVADGHATADALVAGQLTRGPLLLVTSGQEIPAATKSVASALPTWDNRSGKAHKTVYGVGGEGVLKDETLNDLYKVINAAAKGSGSGKESGKLAVASVSVLNVIAGSIDGTATFTWDKLAATDVAAGNVLCAEAKAVGVTLQSGACTFDAHGIKIDNSKVTLVNPAQPGTITVPVEYRGEELEVTFTVYGGVSAAVTPTTGNGPSAATLKTINGSMDAKVTITAPDPASTVTVKKVVSKTGTSATAEIKGNDLIVHINGSAQWAQNDKVKVTLTNAEPGKAPKDTDVEVTIQV